MNIGYVVGESKPTHVSTLTSNPLAVGQYVLVDGKEKILGLVEKSYISSVALENVRNFEEARESKEVAELNVRDKGYAADIMLLGALAELQKSKAKLPAIPPLPGDDILNAESADLKVIFGPDGNNWARIGTLLRNEEIEARIDINRMVSRHLGILAMTGMGKSNLVSLLAKQISTLDGTAIIFDYHDDYGTLDIPNIKHVVAKINPKRLDADSLAEVLEIRDNANIQQRILRMALSDDVKDSGDFWNDLIAKVDSVVEENTEKRNRDYKYAGPRVKDKIEDAQQKFADVLDPDSGDPIERIVEGRINVVNISSLSEKQANVAVSYYLQKVLNYRKESVRAKNTDQKTRSNSKFNSSVFVVIEEAHVFVPKGEETQSKYWTSKIAREGRKFGVGLCIVSQRPRGIDANILSQMGSLAVMKIVQEDDQSQVMSAGESISRGLIEQLSSLNVGDAILVGQWVNLPSIVHVDEVREKKAGSDQDAVSEWKSIKEFGTVAKQNMSDMKKTGLIKD